MVNFVIWISYDMIKESVGGCRQLVKRRVDTKRNYLILVKYIVFQLLHRIYFFLKKSYFIFSFDKLLKLFVLSLLIYC